MTTERIREVESVGFDWGTWNEQFQQLCEYNVQFGHCIVPQKYSANPKLGWWVSNQRVNYRFDQEGKPSCMTPERIRALNGIGFKWSLRYQTAKNPEEKIYADLVSANQARGKERAKSFD